MSGGMSGEPLQNLQHLLSYCAPGQRRVLDAIIEHGGVRPAARALGINYRNAFATVAAVKVKAARGGVSPEHDLSHPVAPGFALRGTSTLYDADGAIKAQWVKTREDADAIRAVFDAAAEAMAETIPREKPRAAPKGTRADLCNVYVLTDFHLGMLAWHEEGGDDWDIDIAEKMLVDWFGEAIAQAPAADTAVFAQLGDFMHADGLEALTPNGKNVLDADTRFQKTVRVAIRSIRRIIGMLLAKHRRVHIIMAEGNHDIASSVWLREWLAASYEDEPRVDVDRSPLPYYCVEWGKTAIFFHHGHKRKPENVDTVFAARFREVFGRTKHAYAHLGHMHFISSRETNLMVVEQHRTLAAPDAYAARGGWISGRDAVVITYSREHGEVARCRINAAMLS